MPGGRPKKEVNWDEVDKLCALHCTGEEIAAFLDMSYDTLELRVKETHGISFPEYFQQKSATGKISLRRRQYELAKKNVAMGIWLGKQWLGQAETTIPQAVELKLAYSMDDKEEQK